MQRWNREAGYRRLTDFDIKPEDTVVEIGGFRGQWASDIFSRYTCRVVTAEPLKGFADFMRERFDHNPRIEVLEVGVGAGSRVENISVSEDGSSLFRRGPQKQTISIVDAGDWFSSLGIEHSPLLIMNCEGSEYEILRRLAELDLLKKFENITVQFHKVGKDYTVNRNTCRTALSRTHAEQFCYPFVWESWQLKRGQSSA